jgi:hypothetical protein
MENTSKSRLQANRNYNQLYFVVVLIIIVIIIFNTKNNLYQFMKDNSNSGREQAEDEEETEIETDFIISNNIDFKKKSAKEDAKKEENNIKFLQIGKKEQIGRQRGNQFKWNFMFLKAPLGTKIILYSKFRKNNNIQVVKDAYIFNVSQINIINLVNLINRNNLYEDNSFRNIFFYIKVLTEKQYQQEKYNIQKRKEKQKKFNLCIKKHKGIGIGRTNILKKCNKFLF